MEAYWKLFIARIKMFLRDKRSLFWSTFFPIMFILIFGLFNFDKMSSSNVAIINNSQSEIATQFVKSLSSIEIFSIKDNYQDLDQAKAALQEGDLKFIFVIPQNFAIPTNPSESVSPLEVYYDKSNLQVNGLVFGVMEQYLSGMNMQIAGTPQTFTFQSKEVDVRNIKYLDVLVPGILAMSIMQGGLFSIAIGIVRFREKGVLTKLRSTPLKIRDFLLALVSSYMVIGIFQTTFIILLSLFVFKVNFYGNMFLIYLLVIMAQLIFLSLGFAIAGVAKTVDMAQGIVQVASMPMMFLSGVFFSKDALPPIVGNIVSYLPLTPFIEALRKVWLQGAGLSGIRTELLFMGGWLIIAVILALKLFKFERK